MDGDRREKLDPRPEATGFMATPRTFGQQFLFKQCRPPRSPSGAPRRRPIGHAPSSATVSTTARLTEDVGVVDLGDDVSGGEPEVTRELVTLLRGCERG